MNRSIRFLAVAALVALPAVSQAQTAITGSISATADISTVFAWGAVTNMSFGVIVPGQAATGAGNIALSRNVGVVYSLPDGANTGKLSMTNANGTFTLTPAYTCGVGTTAGTNTVTFTACDGTSSITRTAPAASVTEYVNFSGSLTAAQTQTTPGAYTGTIRVTATPN